MRPGRRLSALVFLWKRAPYGFDTKAKRSGPVALALKVAKRGRAKANTQNTSAFFGAVNVIR
jgi:hypothetical protein